LSTVEWIELFTTWGLAYAARCERQREAAIASVIATIDEFAREAGSVGLPVRRGAGESR
jgi:pyridoxine 5'-phosphate synthase PdxJ